MPSELNSLLLKIDNCLLDPTIAADTRAAVILEMLAGIDRLFQDTDWEVTRDIFDGVSNDTRRLVVASFVANFGTILTAMSAMQGALADHAKKSEAPAMPDLPEALRKRLDRN